MGLSKIMTVSIAHEFFSNGKVAGLSYEPTPETNRLIQQYKFRVRYQPEGFEFYANKVNRDNVRPIPSSGVTLRWLILCDDPYFKEITELPRINSGRSHVYNNTGVLTRDAELRMNSQENLVESSTPGFVCMIEIRLTTAVFRKISILDYTINWTACATTWKYYYIGQKNFEAPEISHPDFVFTRSIVEENNTTYKADPLAKKLFNIYPDAQHCVFTSNSELKWCQKRYQNIKLMRNGEVVINHLPNPTCAQRGINIINAINN